MLTNANAGILSTLSGYPSSATTEILKEGKQSSSNKSQALKARKHKFKAWNMLMLKAWKLQAPPGRALLVLAVAASA